MARLLADENFPLPVVDSLRGLGHDAMTLADLGRSGMALPDPAVLALAQEQGRVLLTLNRRHFRRLHDAGAQHAGLVLCTVDLDFPGQAGRIHAAIGTGSSLAGRLLRVNRPQR